ncbi:MAG TPA: cytochrome c3 family protein [Candidatus Krumholzibacteria bacterium]|nr:cytochrome c3 family protein [Candidatus Krumholzibacteria bacterium]
MNSGKRRSVVPMARALALLAVLCVTLAGPASAQRRECVDCHEDFKSVMKRSHVHQPARDNCETCHKRHGFTQKLVLVKGMPDLCTECHADVKTELDGGHVHGALSVGGCTACHDPHASDGKGLLRTEATQAELCIVCHKDLEPLTAEKNTHDPFKKGDCSVCHAPHSSQVPGLLVAKESDLCAQCHKDVASGHKKVPGVGDFACSSCHDPHASNKKAKFAANAHEPFATGDCESCHAMENGEVTIGDDFPPSDLCSTCHDNEAALVAGANSHFGAGAMAGKGAAACLECHDPHVSGRPAMLVADQNTLCRKCHDSLPETGKIKGFAHVPFTEGNCTGCHNPHGSSAPHKLAKAPAQLCVTCHAEIVAPAESGKTTHPAMEAAECTDCHAGHVGEDEALLSRPIGEVCADCHDKETHRNGHLPYQTGQCNMCHKNHSHEKDLMAGGVNETCGSCHVDQLKAMVATNKHPALEGEDCRLCHAAHGSENKGLLVESQKSLCMGCHDVADMIVHADVPAGTAGETRNGGAATLHPPVADGNCSACHDAHGSPLPGLLVRSGESLCFGCHGQEKINFSEGHVHTPVAEGKCDACHTPHGSELEDLANATQPGVCTQCHDAALPEFQTAHKQIDVSQAMCTACHAPHSSASEALLNPVVHAPFADGDCETCHEVTTSETGVTKLSKVSATLCYDCHDDKQSGKGHQHVEGVSCVECHQPHSSPFKNLLQRPDKLCTGCHADVLKTAAAGAGKTYVHKPIDTGCQACHKMHEPAAEPFLMTAQRDLCSGCHESIQSRAGDKTQHQPFAKAECSKCHETHVAGERHLLRTAQTDLCQTCHDLKTPAMLASHGNIPLVGKACVSCHDPHSTKAAGTSLVYATKHPPYEDKDCTVCHDTAGKATQNLATCVECHDGHDGYAKVHNGGRDEAEAASVGVCLDCHSPHAGHDKLLVRASVKETCLQCHDRGMFTKQFQHAALDEGCEACHDVHDNDMSKLRGPDANELCAGCHEIENIHTHAVSGKIDPRNGEPLVCVSCHEVHSADHESLLPFDQKRDMCVQCHATGH